ncbi:STAS domain-containing protein [Streptomyces phyllanthi]|uniref:Anti-sigma factor antagonist n=1 Tax=Streptomyces phyllanthi TaxID=1803180 RepID=A0A5N8WDU3_9ACTN|nr:STAS domain-containing protein [Streptomyces phyllanthi]MPY44325.1 STAS domain-containing protein [Streptomyces phyllanthi]
MPPETHDRAADPPEGTAAASGPAPANPYAHSRRAGSYTVVEVSGEIDMATAGFVDEHLDTATAAPEPDVLVDLRGVTFFDCSGLRVLCRAESRARARGGRLRIVSDQPCMRTLLRAAGLLSRFPPLAEPPAELPPPRRPENGSAPHPPP